VWRRAALNRCIRDPQNDEKIAVIYKALSECSAEYPIFYEDKVDIHLNPKSVLTDNYEVSKTRGNTWAE